MKKYEVVIRVMNKEHMDTVVEAIKNAGGEIEAILSPLGH